MIPSKYSNKQQLHLSMFVLSHISKLKSQLYKKMWIKKMWIFGGTVKYGKGWNPLIFYFWFQ